MEHTQLTKRTWRHTGTAAWYQNALVGQYRSQRSTRCDTNGLTFMPSGGCCGDCYRLPVIDGCLQVPIEPVGAWEEASYQGLPDNDQQILQTEDLQ